MKKISSKLENFGSFYKKIFLSKVYNLNLSIFIKANFEFSNGLFYPLDLNPLEACLKSIFLLQWFLKRVKCKKIKKWPLKLFILKKNS